MNNAALDTYLEPFKKLFDMEGVTEVLINRSKEIWVEQNGSTKSYVAEKLDFNHLKALTQLIARFSEQDVTEETPLLSANLPNGYRVQAVIPPACEAQNIILAIRKPSVAQFDLDDCEKMGFFNEVKKGKSKVNTIDKLKDLYKKKKIKEMIREGILSKKNIIISGGTSTGKTTFINSMLREIPSSERIITIEDTREVVLNKHPNRVHLIAPKGDQGRSKATTQDLIEACLRLRPDRIIVGELRGKEAFSFLRAINTGHPGSLSSLHADTPEMAIEQLKLMILQAGLGITIDQIVQYIMRIIDIVIQLKRGPNGERFVSEIFFTK